MTAKFREPIYYYWFITGLLRPEFWTNKNTKMAEPYFLRKGKSDSALRVTIWLHEV